MRFDSISLFATAAAVTGPVLFWRGFRTLKERRLIQNTPTARIRSMAMGLVEISGTIESHSALTAPFSGHECAYWEVDIATQGRRGQWSIVHRNASGSPFYVRDETGLALVYPQGAECKVRGGVEETCSGITLPECYAQYLNDQQLGMRHLWRLGAMRFRERVLEPGQPLFVLGTATPKPQVMSVTDDDVLEATGTDGARHQRLATLHEQTAAIVRQGENERTYIISHQSERELALDLGIHAVGQLVGGPAITILGLGYWLASAASGAHQAMLNQ